MLLKSTVFFVRGVELSPGRRHERSGETVVESPVSVSFEFVARLSSAIRAVNVFSGVSYDFMVFA